MKQSVLALLLGITSAVRMSAEDESLDTKVDVGPDGWDPFVRNIVHENVPPYNEVNRARRGYLSDE